MKFYCNDPRDLSRAPTLEAFLERYRLLIENCAGSLVPGGKLAILMGDYCDRELGFLPLVHHTKTLAFEAGLKQVATDIIRFSHGASSGKKVYRSSFIPGLHDVCAIFSSEVRESTTKERSLTMTKTTTYHVHLYREMRVTFSPIQARSPQEAAEMARQLSNDQAVSIDECDGEDLAALVDVAGDETLSSR